MSHSAAGSFSCRTTCSVPCRAEQPRVFAFVGRCAPLHGPSTRIVTWYIDGHELDRDTWTVDESVPDERE